MRVCCKFVGHTPVCALKNETRIRTSFANPLQVTIELSFDLLLSSELQELSPVLHTLSLFGKLAADTNTHSHTHTEAGVPFNMQLTPFCVHFFN